jgi:hypothetical protein
MAVLRNKPPFIHEYFSHYKRLGVDMVNILKASHNADRHLPVVACPNNAFVLQ